MRFLLMAFLLSGCVSLPTVSKAAYTAQGVLHGVSARAVAQSAKLANDANDALVRCEALHLKTPAERRECLGELTDEVLAEYAEQLKTVVHLYDSAADLLQELCEASRKLDKLAGDEPAKGCS